MKSIESYGNSRGLSQTVKLHAKLDAWLNVNTNKKIACVDL